MTIEKERKFFGFKPRCKELELGFVHEITQSRNFFTGEIKKWQIGILAEDLIRVRTSVVLFDLFGRLCREQINPTDEFLFREEINETNIHGSTSLGAKERIIWKPSK